MNTVWSNTVLVAYSLLPKIAEAIDFSVKSRVNSCFQSRHLTYGVSNEQIIGEIIELNDRKRKIVNLAYIVNSTLDMMRPVDKQIIEERIFKKKTFTCIAQELGIALRTAFRRMEIARLRFAKLLDEREFTQQWFDNEYGNDKFIAPLYKRVQQAMETSNIQRSI